MLLTDDHSGLTILEERDCRRLLAASELGRLAIANGGSPEIFPVNYAIVGDLIVFRSRPGAKVQAARGSRAAFEIDGTDRLRRTGWSVVAKGRLELVEPHDRAWEQVSKVEVDPWAGERPLVLVLHVDIITGRRVGSADDPSA